MSGYTRRAVRASTIPPILALVSALAFVPRLGAEDLVPAPPSTRSVELVDRHVPVYAEPRDGARRRGTVALGTRLPYLRRVSGSGCETGVWVEVGPSLFACEELVRYSALEPAGVPQPPMAAGALLPFQYVFVRDDGAHGYAEPSHYFADDFVETFGEGFGLVMLGQRTLEGVSFVRLHRGTWVSSESVSRVRGSSFEGTALSEGKPLDFAFVRTPRAIVASAPGGRTIRRAGRREIVTVAAVEGAWALLADGTAIRLEDLNRPELAQRPEGVEGHERWIDVSVSEQVLVAYEGDRPVFVTLVSTGARRPHSETPIGTFRIWAKLATSDMGNTEDAGAESYYLIENVPWVQFFEGANGLHAAFWHDDFGHRRSHGCVNLSPKDARFLFGFTAPTVPDGYEAYLPTADERPTVVRVRE